MVTQLDCIVKIDGADLSEYVGGIEIERDICRIAATCALQLDPDAYSSIESWDELEIWEMGTKTFTGYVDEVSKERMPAACVVTGTDVLKRAVRHFIDEDMVSGGESLEYWVNQLLAVAGLGSANIAGSTGKVVPADYLFLYQFAGDYLQMIAAYAGWAIYADGWGTVHFKDPQYSVPAHAISGAALTKSGLERARDRMWIRNRALVFGVGDVKADVSRPNHYLPGETIAAAVASPEWDTVEKAILTANEMLDEYNDPLDTKFAMIPGEPSYELGQTVNVNDMFTGLGVGRPYRALVTSIVSRMSEDGYVMRVGLDAKCPRIWGWGRYMPSMAREWLSLDGGGVYRYDFVSGSWVAENEGLTGDALYVREVEPDPMENDIAWCATLDGIYKYIYGFWEQETVSEPVNDAGDDPAPTSADLDFVSIEVVSTEYMVATARHKSLNRGWMYESSGSTWSNEQLAVGASYDVKPMAGPQALYVPEEGRAYITADAGATRKLIRWKDGAFSVPYSTSGTPFEVAGPWSMPETIYLFGDPSPILLKSANGGDTQADIKPGDDPVRPVLALPWREDDLFVVSSSGSGFHRDIDEWITKATVPITPGCGMRSQYGGVQILLGQKEAGDTYKVAFSGTLGGDWEDMSEGLPDIAVTSIAGLEGTSGSGMSPPKVEVCPPIEFKLGRYWLRRLSGYHTPYFGWTWGPEFLGSYNSWYKELRDNRPWLGAQVTHVFIKDCQLRDPQNDGYTFEVEMWVSSPIGVYDSTLFFTECVDMDDVNEGVYRYEDYANPQYELNWCAATSITRMAGTPTYGWFKILFKPFVSPSTLAGRCLYKVSPYMPITLYLSSNQVFSRRRVSVSAEGETGCHPPGDQNVSGWFGERNYPDDYLTWQQEFSAKFDNKWDIGPLRHECVGDGFNPYRSRLFTTKEPSEPEYWFNWQHYDLGYGIIHVKEGYQ